MFAAVRVGRSLVNDPFGRQATKDAGEIAGLQLVLLVLWSFIFRAVGPGGSGTAWERMIRVRHAN